MKTNTNILKAPFNFVPLNKKVYFPAWAERISQDIPFSDGLDGVIDVSIETLTPLFIRNGHSQEDALQAKSESANSKDSGNSSISGHPKRYNSFSNVDGKFMIPGTSLKGCIRKNLEIMSFGKMRLQQSMKFAEAVNLTDPTYREKMKDVKCGWMYKTEEGWFIKNVGAPKRITHHELDHYFNRQIENSTKKNIFKNHFSRNSRFDLNNEKEINKTLVDPKRGFFKYLLLDDVKIYREDLFNCRFSINEDGQLEFNSSGDIEGSVVLTGQPSQWTQSKIDEKAKGNGKYKEFVFSSKVVGKPLKISKDKFEEFEFIYKESADWISWYQAYNQNQNVAKQGIPVFFREKKGTIIDFGLTQLYKLPYSQTPYLSLFEQHRSSDMDLSDCLFGKIDGDSLRGRVQFSPLFSNDAVQQNSIKLILNSPKASYYPLYLRQNVKLPDYNKYNGDTCEIAGWKRYYMRKDTWVKNMDNDKLDTVIYPIQKNVHFKGKIRFHNLRPIELGALLSSLTNHQTTNSFHQLGQGKPYGFGKIKLNIDLNLKKSVDYYVGLFERNMDVFLGTSYISNKVILENVILNSNDVDKNSKYQYMNMSMEKGQNEFENVKASKEIQLPFSQEKNIVSLLSSAIKDEDREEINEKINIQLETEKILARQNKIHHLELEINTLFDEGKFVEFRTLVHNNMNKYSEIMSKYQEQLISSFHIEYNHYFEDLSKALSSQEASVVINGIKTIEYLNTVIWDDFDKSLFDFDSQLKQLLERKETLLNNMSFGDLIYSKNNIDQVLKVAEEYINNDNTVCEDDSNILVEHCGSLYSSMPNKSKKNWKQFKSIKWNKLRELFPDKAEDIFNQITRKK